MDCGGIRRLFRCLAIIGTTFAITWGSALAAPPQDLPGNSEHAPGQQKKEAEQPGPPEAPPGQQKKEDAAAAAPTANGNGAYRNADRPAKPKKAARPNRNAPAESSRYTNAQGKPKRNVPAVAETAPAASASGPGKSGIHKLTICHKGHAITVDVHATAAHLKHGDTFLPAGTKGRASCGGRNAQAETRSAATDVAQFAKRREQQVGFADASRSARTAATRTANGAPNAAAPTEGVLAEATSVPQSEYSAVADPTASGAELPFTGSALAARLALVGLLLVALGAALALGRFPLRLPSPASLVGDRPMPDRAHDHSTTLDREQHAVVPNPRGPKSS